jgi:HSP20 family protein
MAGSLSHWEPFAELAELRSRFDRMFGDVTNGHDREWMPAIDIRREDDRIVVHADMPGIKPDEIKIEVVDDALTLSGRHEEQEERKEADYVRRERRVGTFSRTIALPQGIDAKQIKAHTRDGVLEVDIPLPKESASEPVTITPTAS